jgi:hypothetical protein
LVDLEFGIIGGFGRQVGIFAGCQDTAMAEDLLNLKQVDTRFNQMGGITVPKTVHGELFFIPQD